MTKLEQDFTDALLAQLRQAETLTGVAEPRLAEQAQKLGGPAAVKNLLARGQQTRQFASLKAQGRLDLSPEALVVRGKYTELFTDDEANACLELLLESGMY